MADLFKNLYNKNFFDAFTESIQNVIPSFNRKTFLTEVHTEKWKSMEFKQRMHHVAMVLNNHLSQYFRESIQQLKDIISDLRLNGIADKVKYPELVFMLIPDYIEHAGLDEFDISIDAFEHITTFTSCEFAVRPFILKYQEKMFYKIMEWTQHENEHVRRLASEGCRPRLPWAMALPYLKIDPSPIFPVLENLKSDPSEYVRRSVANNLNDISKDHPQTIIDIAKQWHGKSEETNWIVKHACRTLLKAGDQEVMQLFGFAPPEEVEIRNLELLTDTISLGSYLEFNFELINHFSKQEKIRLEYAIYYLRQNGSHSKKVFKISEKDYPAKSTTQISRRQLFKPMTSRALYPGEHLVSIIINGHEVEERSFMLKE